MTHSNKQPARPWRDRPPCCDSREPCIEVQNLTVSYRDKPAVQSVDLTLSRGCISAIVGPSGCGKSTFLHALNRLTDMIDGCAVQGSIRFDGTNILDAKTDLVALRRRIGMIFQKPNPFPISIRKNLSFPLKHHGMRKRGDRDEAIEAMLRQVGLWEEVKDRLNSPALSLSGGQQQRLCLARALVLEPEVILLDEPCSALDPISSGTVEEMIASLRTDYTIVIVTHNLAQARRIADDVAMFWVQNGAGTVIEASPVDQFFDSPRNDITAAYINGVRG